MDTKSFFHKQVKTYQSIFPKLRLWLAQNKGITIEMVLEDIKNYPDKKDEWAFGYLCYTIPVDTLFDNNIYPTNNKCKTPTIVSMNLTIHTILTYKQIEWDWGYLTVHKQITIEDILDHLDLPWVPTQIPNNPNFTYQHYLLLKENYPHLIHNTTYIFNVLSAKATYQEIMECPEQYWTTNCLRSPTIKKEDIIKLVSYFTEKYPDHSSEGHLAWNCCGNPNLSFNDVYDIFGECAFRFACACHNFTYEDFLKYPLEKWDVPSLNLKLPLHYILAHPEYQWHWYSILAHSTELTYDTMHNLPDFLIQELKELWKHKSIPFDLCIKGVFFQNDNIDPIERKRMMADILVYYRDHPPPVIAGHMYLLYILTSELFLEPSEEEIKEYFAKKRIIRLLTEVHVNPSYKQCRKRLFREYEEFPCKRVKK